MTTAAVIVALVVSLLLFAAGLGKVTNLAATASTLSALGIPAAWAGRAAFLVPLSEIATALSVLFSPGSRWTHLGVAALGGAFALAGMVAVIRNQRIHCNCIGTSGGYLGRSQLLALPAWAGAAWMLHVTTPKTFSFIAGAAIFAAVALALTTLKAAALWRAVREARGDRLSAEEMYLWLPQH